MKTSTLFPLVAALIVSVFATDALNLPLGDTLEECLRASNVTVIAPDDTLYDTVRQTWNSRIQYSPKFIVQPNSTQEVQHSVRCAATHSNVAVTVKSGGHGYAGYAIGGEDGDLTIDVTNFNNIDVDKESSLVRAGTGNHLWDLYKTIYEDNLVLPGGTCPQVGIGGHASFGGYGPLSRKMGLLLDRIVEAEIVYANGTAANVTQGEDIFFAITGAAPSFAIVTQFTFLAERAPENTVIFSHSLINRTAESAADAFDAFVSFINRNVTNDFSAWITLGPGSFELNGMYFGSQDDFEVIAKPLFEGVKLSSNDSQDVSQTSEFIEMYKQIYGDFSPVAEPKPFYSKSLMINEPLTVDQSLSFFNYLSNSGVQAKNQGYDWYIIVDPYNGVIHEKSTQERSFAHRNTLLTFQFFAEMGESEETLFSLVDGMVDSITELPKAAYPNYVDPRLINWQELYYGPNYLRLQEIKGVVDPNNTYRFPQSSEVRSSSDKLQLK
ncbi:FAD-binding domain-containing protein [Wallemia mellicola]|uniref:FAD-binding domain-containing protein n=1 Tax=Wallemia mellicola TaxID=1708541 RepID=A0AB74KD45_9BASI|nr:FAD-binding domain-containing protein [Wallemia mellicola]TIC08300.1 FAD-binding domain-containing protein [Wallemia mellicola]TIC34934.1 FAD-binding domain-containing protein [Wallemia mellicola]TIC61795.1 FAD-binding domain-containing protein [Wallemia mellicola]